MKKWGFTEVTLSALGPMTKRLKWKPRVCNLVTSAHNRGRERRMSLPSWGFSSLPEWKGFLLMRTLREGWDESAKGFLLLWGGGGREQASQAAQRGNSVCCKVSKTVSHLLHLPPHFLQVFFSFYFIKSICDFYREPPHFLDLAAAGLVSCLLCRTTPTQIRPNMWQVDRLS